MAEYLPVDAKVAASCDLKAAEHSLQKWSGLLPAALEKHEVKVRIGSYGEMPYIYDPNDGEARPLYIDSRNCALCQANTVSCARCPIVVHSHGIPCYGYPQSPWSAWMNNINPHPMVELLQTTVNKLKEQNENTGSVSQV